MLKKLFVTFNLLVGFLVYSQASLAVTAQEQEAGLKAAGLTSVGGGVFVRGTLAVQVLSDGSYNFLVPFDSYFKASQVKAIAVESALGGTDSGSLVTYNIDNEGRVSAMDQTPDGSGGGANDKYKAAITALVGTPLSQQLSNSGFKSITDNVWKRNIGDYVIVVVVDNNSFVGIFKNAKKDTIAKLKNTQIVGYQEVKGEFRDDKNSALVVQNSIFKFIIVSDIYGGSAEDFEFLKDLKDVDLKELGFKEPPVKKDSTGFQIGGVNPTPLILGLASINGKSMDQIAADARKVPGCSHGDPLLAHGESLTKIMAEDNDKVKKLGLTHQDLSKPLFYVQALLGGQYTTKFVLHGVQYSVSNLMTPMCGSLDSPFNDNYGTAITFPTITNLKTGKTLDYSLLHPYLINQYGFYGSHANRSYVSPEAIIEVFDYLRQ